ncbi:hypothetical protein GGF37_001693 [Kickxella alabastrina]|nr:hypothetical protein GGF37_001693 [Kickxella alabastrina]
MYSNIEVMESNMFLTVDFKLNKHCRRQMEPSMSLANLKQMELIILDAGTKQVFNKWDWDIEKSADKQRARICYHGDFMFMTFDIISTLGFGQTHSQD